MRPFVAGGEMFGQNVTLRFACCSFQNRPSLLDEGREDCGMDVVRRWQILSTAVLLSCGCSTPEEPPRVEVPIVVDSSGLEVVMTNLGYEVSLRAADVVIRDLEFTVKGEIHTSLLDRIADALVPTAWAHPGHYEGGDVTGELRGAFLLHFAADEVDPAEELGTATLIIGDYHSLNFYFEQGDAGDLEGHTALLHGTARRDDTEIEFAVTLDSPESRQLVGVPFETRVEEGAEIVAGLRLLVQDPFEEDTLFDDVDFIALDGDADGKVLLGPDSTDAASVDAYNQIHRKFQTHDHFDVRVQD